MNPYTYKRSANPSSGWARLLSYLILVVSLYYHLWWLLVLVIGFIAFNPVLFPDPKKKDKWMTRAVLGEELWLKQGKREGMPAVINILNTLTFLLLIYTSIAQKTLSTIILSVLVIGLKLWFLKFMAVYYDEKKKGR